MMADISYRQRGRVMLLMVAASYWGAGPVTNAFSVPPKSNSRPAPRQAGASTKKYISSSTERLWIPPLAAPLHAVSTPPAEDEKRKKSDGNGSNNDNNDEWTESGGGFIPNILRRRSRKSKRPAKPIIDDVVTMQEYKDAVVDEPDRIVVVHFYATWCRSCRAVAPSYLKLAKDYSDVKFVKVPLTKENAYLHEGLGVPSVPFAHIYHPEAGLVEEMKMSKRHFPKLKKRLKTYVDGQCDWPGEEEEALVEEAEKQEKEDFYDTPFQ